MKAETAVAALGAALNEIERGEGLSRFVGGRKRYRLCNLVGPGFAFDTEVQLSTTFKLTVN